jgi:hypothetical protein
MQVNFPTLLTYLKFERVTGLAHRKLVRHHHIDHSLYVPVKQCASQALAISRTNVVLTLKIVGGVNDMM